MHNIKIHWTHKARIRRLFKEGFTDEELAIMYKISWSTVRNLVRGIVPHERI